MTQKKHAKGNVDVPTFLSEVTTPEKALLAAILRRAIWDAMWNLTAHIQRTALFS